MIHLGAVIFDDADIPGPGWACRAGERPFRIAGVQSLSTDTLWLVNVTYDEMYQAGLAQHAFFRGAEYLRLPLHSLFGEWGLLDEDDRMEDPEQAAVLLSGVFERMVRLYCLITGISRERWKPSKNTLRSGLRGSLMRPDQRLDPKVHEAVREATQAYTRCRPVDGSRFTGEHSAQLTIPRLRHGAAVLDCPVPATTDYRILEAPPPMESISEWLDAHPGPMLLQVTAEDFHSSIGPLINFGAVAPMQRQNNERGFRHMVASTRQWITQDEARMFAHFGHLTVHDAIHFPRWVQIRSAVPGIRELFARVEALDHLSYTLGLMAENLWTGLTMDQVAHPSDRDASANLTAPFLRAADRMNSLQYALDVSNQGVDVLGYGVGRIGVLLKDGKPGITDEALRIAATSGLVSPFPRPGKGPMPCPGTPVEDETYQALLEIVAGGMTETYMEVDREVVSAYCQGIPDLAEACP